jgi:hypothetical protein
MEDDDDDEVLLAIDGLLDEREADLHNKFGRFLFRLDLV